MSSIKADNAAVELGQLLVERFEDLGVVVPAAVVHGDEPHAALDQPAGQQHRLAGGVPAVAVAQLLDSWSMANARRASLESTISRARAWNSS